MKWLVLLAGCGLGDGSCVEEVILTYAALDQHNCDYTPVAEDLLVPSVNHITEQPSGSRSALEEAARIGRGRIKEIGEIAPEDYDALLIPGGMGLLVNYRQSDRVRACIAHFVRHGKAIGTMCAGIDFLRQILHAGLLQEETRDLEATACCCDSGGTIFYTPAFRKTGSCYDVLLGVDAMIRAIMARHSLSRPVSEGAGLKPAP